MLTRPSRSTPRCELAPYRSNQNAIDDFGRQDAGEPLVQSLEFERELVVIEAEEMKDGGMKVADMYRIFHDVVGKVIGFAERHAGFHPAARHPHAEATRMMIAP